MPYILYYVDFENLFVINEYIRQMSEAYGWQMIMGERNNVRGLNTNKVCCGQYKHKHPHRIRVPTKRLKCNNYL